MGLSLGRGVAVEVGPLAVIATSSDWLVVESVAGGRFAEWGRVVWLLLGPL